MKRLATILLFTLIALSSEAQQIKGVMTLSTGIKATWGATLQVPNPNGRKHICFIYLHGIDHRGARVDTTSANGIARVFTKGIPLLARTSPLPWVIAPGGSGLKDMWGQVVFAPMCSSEYGLWRNEYIEGMLNVIESQYGNVVDLSRVHIVGFSMGGAGTWGSFLTASIRRRVASFWIIAGGISGTNSSLTSTYQAIANEGIPIYVFNNVNDKLSPISYTDATVEALNLRNPRHPVQYWRLSGLIGGSNYHDIWPFLLDSTAGDSYPMTNGDNWVNGETIFKRVIRHTNRRNFSASLIAPVIALPNIASIDRQPFEDTVIVPYEKFIAILPDSRRSRKKLVA